MEDSGGSDATTVLDDTSVDSPFDDSANLEILEESIEHTTSTVAPSDFDQQIRSMSIDELRTEHRLLWQKLQAVQHERDVLLEEQTCNTSTSQTAEQVRVLSKMKVRQHHLHTTLAKVLLALVQAL
jgi:hypothetical protein